MPCIVCLILANQITDMDNSHSEAHHVNKIGHGHMGGKTDDTRTVPLCVFHHTEFHLIGRNSFEAKYDVDFEYLIKRFNTIWRERNEAIQRGR